MFTIESFRASRKEMKVDSDEFRKFILDLEGKDAEDVAYELENFDVVLVYETYLAYIPQHKVTKQFELGYGIDKDFDKLEDAEEVLWNTMHSEFVKAIAHRELGN